MQNEPAPRRRRSEMYSTPSPAQAPVELHHTPPPIRRTPDQPAAGTSQPPARIVPPSAPSGGFIPNRPVQRQAQEMPRPTRMERPAQAVRRKEAEPLPRALPAGIIIAILLLTVLLTTSWLMQGYLIRQEDARVQAHQRLMDEHPISWRAMIEHYAAENNLQPAYVAAIILNESSYRTNAESSVHARGLMQLMEDTAEWIAHKLDVPNYSFEMLWDAETNIRFGCWYLGWLSELFDGDPAAVTAAYHAGQGQVAAWLANPAISPDGRTLQIDRMPEGNTKIYTGRVTRAYAIYDALYFHALNRDADSSADADTVGSTGTGNERG